MAMGPSRPAPGKRISRPPVAPTSTMTTSIATLRYQGAEPLCMVTGARGRLLRVVDEGDDDGHRRGDERDAQVLDHGDDAVVTAELAGDGDQTGGAACHQRERPRQRADVAVQAEQRAGEDAEHQRRDRDAEHDRPVRAKRRQRVAVDHRADVDAEHALRGDACLAGHPRRVRARAARARCRRSGPRTGQPTGRRGTSGARSLRP